MKNSYALPRGALEGFRDASSYDAYRPSYPPEAVESLLGRLKVSGEANVNLVEIGSGTGKFTELLAARAENFNIVAVEPHAQMREQLEAKKLRGVQVVDGHAGKTPVEEEWADACVVAQAFHWFANEEALREIQRVLKPGAVLGLIWNVEDYNKPAAWAATTAWEQKLNELIYGLGADGSPRFRDAKWQDVFARQPERTPFEVIRDTLKGDLPRFSLPIGEDRVSWTAWLSPDDLWRRFSTLSQVAVLQGRERESLKAAFDDVLAGDGVFHDDKGRVGFHGVTYFAWTDRL